MKVSTKCRRTTGDKESRRQNSRCYELPIDGSKRKVCKTFFLSTLDISNRVVEDALSHAEHGSYSKVQDQHFLNTLLQ